MNKKSLYKIAGMALVLFAFTFGGIAGAAKSSKVRKPASNGHGCMAECIEEYESRDFSKEEAESQCAGSPPCNVKESWTCECKDGSGDGGTSEGASKAEAKANCKKANGGHGKVGECTKDE